MSESVESTEQRHKKENKDLQSKIQSLKKGVGKGDKKKRKEIQDEISRLEIELANKHMIELSLMEEESVATVQENVANSTETDVDVPSTKVSRAQKRRDKKAADEKARIEMIRKQEEENINGPRNLEIEKIKGLLSERGLMLHSVPSNGDCLYSAISHQINLMRSNKMTVGQLRQLTAQHIQHKKNDFVPFLSNATTGDMLTDEEFEDYCNKIEVTKSWGGQVELQALCEILKCPIQVIQSTPPHVITQGDHLFGEPLTVTYHRHMYGLGEHYNSTEPLAINNSDDEFVDS